MSAKSNVKKNKKIKQVRFRSHRCPSAQLKTFIKFQTNVYMKNNNEGLIGIFCHGARKVVIRDESTCKLLFA